MEERLSRLRNYLLKPIAVGDSSSASQDNHPQLGFKLYFSRLSKVLKVKVIGARLLPLSYGTSKPVGYLVKVTAFPQKEKFETAIVKDSWPTFNEEFSFPLQTDRKQQNLDDYLKGKFISFTVYAVLENIPQSSASSASTSESKLRGAATLKRFFSFSEFGENSTKFRRSFRHSLNSRRTVGTITYNLDRKLFVQTIGDNIVHTPDIWRDIQEITTGGQTREGKNGTAEVTLSYTTSEDGKNDTVEISVTRFRCSVQTMQQHEKLGGQLYIKITAFEQEDLIQKMKSDKFKPTISLKLQASTSTLRANVNNSNMETMKILVRLMCRDMLGQKKLLGKIEIDCKSDVWKEIFNNPSVPITRSMFFE